MTPAEEGGKNENSNQAKMETVELLPLNYNVIFEGVIKTSGKTNDKIIHYCQYIKK